MTEKINLLIDTNAFSLLSMLEFRREKLSKLVFKYFNAYTCRTVFDEFGITISSADQGNKLTYRLLDKKKENIFPISPYTKAIEEQLFHLEYFPKDSQYSRKDKGERHLVCAAIEHVYRGRFSQCIILSEDSRAIEGFIRNIADVFPVGYIWSVFDLVIFLFFLCKITYEDASVALRELISSPAVSVKKYRRNKNRSNTVEEARQLMLADQLKRLEKIKEMINYLKGGNRGN